MIHMLLITTAAALGVGFSENAPPATSEPAGITEPIPLSPEALAGIWLNHGGPQVFEGLLVYLGADGTASFDSDGRLDTTPLVPATYRIDGTRIDFTADDDSWCPGETWTWEATIPEDGRLEIVHAPGGCGSDTGDQWHWIRLSPASAAGTALEAPSEPGSMHWEPTMPTMRGIWLRIGTGELLRFDDDGSYAIDDRGQLGDDPDDTGQFELDGSTITFTSSGGSAACNPGDTFHWDDVVRDLGRVDEESRSIHWLTADSSGSECAGSPRAIRPGSVSPRDGEQGT